MQAEPEKRESSLQSQTLKRNPKLLPKILDYGLAGGGLAAAISLLTVLQGVMGVKLFAAPMMASGIIFFAAQKPPDPKGFLVGTLAGTLLITPLFLLLPKELQNGIGAGALLVVYKFSNSMFPPAAVYPVLIAQTLATTAPDDLNTPIEVTKFALFPWLVGHAALYGASLGMAEVRCKVRTWTMQSQLRGLSADVSSATLKETFSKFDTSGDGYLDAEELRLALKVARGEQVPLEDCKELIASIDSDGDGVVDFDEFSDICNGKVGF